MNRKLVAILMIACIVSAVVIPIVSARYISGGRRISGWQLLDETITGGKISNETIDSEHYVNGSIDNEHGAANSIRNATNEYTTERSVTGTTYADSYVNTTITLARTSVLIINYAAESKNEAGNITFIKAEVGGVAADPTTDINFMPAGRTAYEAASYVFYNSSVPSGTHNINISLRSNSTGTVNLINQSLAVIALPA